MKKLSEKQRHLLSGHPHQNKIMSDIELKSVIGGSAYGHICAPDPRDALSENWNAIEEPVPTCNGPYC